MYTSFNIYHLQSVRSERIAHHETQECRPKMLHCWHLSIGGSRGNKEKMGPLPESKFLHFQAVFGKNLSTSRLAPHLKVGTFIGKSWIRHCWPQKEQRDHSQKWLFNDPSYVTILCWFHGKRFPYHFFWGNQWKADIKIFSWTQCEGQTSLVHFGRQRQENYITKLESKIPEIYNNRKLPGFSTCKQRIPTRNFYHK